MNVPVWGWVIGAGVALLALGGRAAGERKDIAPVYERVLAQEKDLPTLRTFAAKLRAAGYDFQATMIEQRADGIVQGAPMALVSQAAVSGSVSGATMTAAQVGLQPAQGPVLQTVTQMVQANPSLLQQAWMP